MPAPRRKFSEDLLRVIEADAAPEVAAVGIESAAIDAPAGARRSLGLGARSGDLGDMPAGVAVERDERDPVGLGDPAERVTAAEGRLELLALRMPAGGAAALRGHGPRVIGCVYDLTKSYISEFSGQFAGVVGRDNPRCAVGHLHLGLRTLGKLSGRLLQASKRNSAPLP